MKLIVVTCLKEYQEEVAKIFKQAHVYVFSVTDMMGFKETDHANLMDEWFAAGKERFDSVVLFSFTAAANTDAVIGLVNEHNTKEALQFPIRAFVVPVEKCSY
jgi:hypothetical protein